MDVANTQTSDESANTPMPTMSGSRRPFISLIGPAKICPMAIPAIVMVSVSWIIEMPTPNSSGINGRLGRYISVDKGAIAVSIPNKTVSQIRPFLLFIVINYPVHPFFIELQYNVHRIPGYA